MVAYTCQVTRNEGAAIRIMDRGCVVSTSRSVRPKRNALVFGEGCGWPFRHSRGPGQH